MEIINRKLEENTNFLTRIMIAIAQNELTYEQILEELGKLNHQMLDTQKEFAVNNVAQNDIERNFIESQIEGKKNYVYYSMRFE